MVGCELLDWKCIFVNELIGSAALAVLFAAILFFVFSSKIKIGFRTTIVIAIPLILILGMAIGGFEALYAFITLLVALMIAAVFQKIVGNQGFI